MKCKSCNEQIEARMRKALSANECPYCGGQILDKETMQQLLDLRSIFEPQRFTDNVDYDRRIKEKVIRVLMEHTKCVKVKDVKQDEDIVKLSEKKITTTRSMSSAQTDTVKEQQQMRKDIYRKVYEEQYGSPPPEEVEVAETISEEDKEAAKDVVFSNVGDPETAGKVERLKAAAKTSTKNKPIRRIE